MNIQITADTQFNWVMEQMDLETCYITGVSLAPFAISIEKCLLFVHKVISEGHEARFLDFRPVISEDSDVLDIITYMIRAQHKLVSRRTKICLQKRRERGLSLGRPKGVPNKSMKLDSRVDELKKYLNKNVSKAAIARLLGVHPQTVYDYIERNGLGVVN